MSNSRTTFPQLADSIFTFSFSFSVHGQFTAHFVQRSIYTILCKQQSTLSCYFNPLCSTTSSRHTILTIFGEGCLKIHRSWSPLELYWFTILHTLNMTWGTSQKYKCCITWKVYGLVWLEMLFGWESYQMHHPMLYHVSWRDEWAQFHRNVRRNSSVYRILCVNTPGTILYRISMHISRAIVQWVLPLWKTVCREPVL